MNSLKGSSGTNDEEEHQTVLSVVAYPVGVDDDDDVPSSPIIIMDPFEEAADEYYDKKEQFVTFPSSYEIVLQHDQKRPQRSKVTFIIEDQSLFDELSYCSHPEMSPKGHRRRASQDKKIQRAIQEQQFQGHRHDSNHQDQECQQEPKEDRNDCDSFEDDTLSTKDSLSNSRHEWGEQTSSSAPYPCDSECNPKKGHDGIDDSFHTLATAATTISFSSSSSSKHSSSRPSSPPSYSKDDFSSLVIPSLTMPSPSSPSSHLPQVWDGSADDSYFTEGFICVGELPRIY